MCFQLTTFALVNPNAPKQATTQMRQQRVHPVEQGQARARTWGGKSKIKH